MPKQQSFDFGPDFELEDEDELIEEDEFGEHEYDDLLDDDFDGDVDPEDDVFERRYINPPKHVHLKPRQINYNNAREFARGLDFSQPLTIADVPGNFIFGDVFEAILEVHGFSLERLILETLSFSKANVDSFHNLLTWTNPDGSPFVKRLDIITSDYFRSHYKETLIPYMFEQLDIEDRFQFATCRTHKKTAILITTCGKFIYITGSANLRSSDNVEEITIITDESICLAKAAQADRIIEKFHHLNHGVPRIKKKALNSDATWEAVANLEDGSSRKSRGRKKK